MRRRMTAVRSPRFTAPILGTARWWIIVPLPPYGSVRAQRHIGENRVMPDGGHGIGVCLGSRSRSYAEKARFRVNRPEPTVRTNPEPCNIVPDGMNFPALHARWRHQHREVGFAAGARKCAANVMHLAFGIFHAHAQHMLGEPALFLTELARNPQSEAFLGQQSVAAVTRAHAPDRIVLGLMTDKGPLDVEIGFGMETTREII